MPILLSRAQRAARRGACTHIAVTRRYDDTGVLTCDICKTAPSLGWLYRCTQDHQGFLPASDFGRPEGVKKKKSCDNLAALANPDHSSGSKPAANQGSWNVEPSLSSAPTSTSRSKVFAPVSTCGFKICSRCRPTFRDRAMQSLNTVLQEPFEAHRPPDWELENRRVSDRRLVANIARGVEISSVAPSTTQEQQDIDGQHQQRCAASSEPCVHQFGSDTDRLTRAMLSIREKFKRSLERYEERPQLGSHNGSSTGAREEQNSSNNNHDKNKSGRYWSHGPRSRKSWLRYKVPSIPSIQEEDEGEGGSDQGHAMMSPPTAPGENTYDMSQALTQAPVEHGEVDIAASPGMLTIPRREQDDAQEAPHGEDKEHGKGKAWSDEVSVAGGVAVTEEGVETGTADIIMHT